MKRIILTVCVIVPLAGCASHREMGGTTEKQQEFSTQSDEGQPGLMSSPSFRPGINREDPRDSQFTTRPQPEQVPNQSPP
jgi:hypothetical protein